MVVHLSWPGGPLRGTFRLPASKSESNRVLILRALAGGGIIDNLSHAHDPQFLTAYLAVQNRRAIVTGTARMQQRPIGPLVDALRELGAQIDYLENEGFPPLRLGGFQYSGRDEVTVRADVSSQFISALLLVAPLLPAGLTVRFAGALVSAPYIRLTTEAMKRWGAAVHIDYDVTGIFHRGSDGEFYTATPLRPPRVRAIRVEATTLRADTRYVVEADWSSAAFAYALLAVAPPYPDAALWLPGLRADSLQGDRRIADWLPVIGLLTEPTEEGVWLRWGEPVEEVPDFNFVNCPDLAPAFIVALAGLSAAADFTGLEGLRLKESDRLAALQHELAKFGTELLELDEREASLVARPDEEIEVDGQRVETFDDHRIAMAFAALAMLGPLTIENPEVVRKSFPEFWAVLAELGFEVEFENE